jgi:serine/threonine protein kinase
MNEEELHGGKVIASGGFGCVFDPALKCMDKEKNISNPENYISKLMLKSDAEYEYNEINKIRAILKVIPNYNKYFLLDDIHICKPNKLNRLDLQNYNNKCGILKKNNISIRNINENLTKLYSLTMPNGGINIESYINKLNLNETITFLYKLTPVLLKLLICGILPMNKKNIYHSDIKDTNILIDNNFLVRLIDWGISTIYTPFHIPSSWKNKPLIFNSPFSIILFTDIFKQDYTLFAEKYHYNNEKIRPHLHTFLKEYIYKWIRIRGEGHLSYINTMMYYIFTKRFTTSIQLNTTMIENKITIPYIIKYLNNTIDKYITFNKKNDLNLQEYVDNIFIHNIDIWGFCSIFYPFYEIYSLNYSYLADEQKLTHKKLRNIFVYLFTTYDKLNITKLIYMFNSIQIFEKIPRPYFILGLTKNTKHTKNKTKKNKTKKNKTKKNITKKKYTNK